MSETNVAQPAEMSAAQRIKAAARNTVTGPSGESYRIRMLTPLLLMEQEVVPPTVFYGNEEEKRAAIATMELDTVEGIDRLVRGSIVAALEDPPVWTGDAPCPETHITLGDIPKSDWFWLFERAMAESGIDVTLIRGLSFRPTDGRAGDPPRPDRDEAGNAGLRRGDDAAGEVGV